MKVEVWSLPGCSRCEAAKARIRDAGHEVVERDLESVKSAETRDVDVLTQITLQNGYAPVLRDADGERGAFIEPDYLDAWLENHAGGA